MAPYHRLKTLKYYCTYKLYTVIIYNFSLTVGVLPHNSSQEMVESTLCILHSPKSI